MKQRPPYEREVVANEAGRIGDAAAAKNANCSKTTIARYRKEFHVAPAGKISLPKIPKAEETPHMTEFPRIKDLPPDEQEPFGEYLYGQTRPLIIGLPMAEQDGYYLSDYLRWKSDDDTYWD